MLKIREKGVSQNFSFSVGSISLEKDEFLRGRFRGGRNVLLERNSNTLTIYVMCIDYQPELCIIS